MKKIFCFLVLGAFLAFGAVAPAHANKVDMKDFTCEQLNEKDEDSVFMILAWIAGGLAASMDTTVFDADFIVAYANAVEAGCGKDMKAKVLDISIQFAQSQMKK